MAALDTICKVLMTGMIVTAACAIMFGVQGFELAVTATIVMLLIGAVRAWFWLTDLVSEIIWGH